MSEPQHDPNSKEPPLTDRLVKWAEHKESKPAGTGVREHTKEKMEKALAEEVDGCFGTVDQSSTSRPEQLGKLDCDVENAIKVDVPLHFVPSHPHFCCHSSCRCYRVAIDMRVSSQSAIALITVLSLVPSYVLSQACAATSQNPRCDPSFSNLICCPYPNVCYWADRQKTPGCCPQGQVCGVGGGGVVTPAPEPETTITAPAPEPETTITAPAPEPETTITATAPAPEPETTITAPAPAPEATITTADQPTCTTTWGGAVETVTSGVVGVWSTVVCFQECLDYYSS
jgi:hypothetical protein